MSRVWGRAVAAAGLTCIAIACGTADQHEPDQVAQVQAALSSNDRILSFEGAIGAAAGNDWRPGNGTTIAAASAHVDGQQALSLSGSQNPSAVSTPLAALGPVASKAGVEVLVPASLAGQSWLGQVALVLNAPSVGVYSQYVGPTALTGPVGEFRHYEIPLPADAVTALSSGSYSDLTVTIQLDVPSTAAFLVDRLSFGQTTGSGGAGGSANGGTSGLGGSGNGSGATSGSSGASGTAGSAGSTGGAASTGGAGPNGETIRFSFKLPSGVAAADVAMGSTGGPISLNDGADLLEPSGGQASLSTVENTTQVDRIGVSADVKNVWSEGPVFLSSRAIVHGFAKSAQTVTSQDSTSQVLGGITNDANLRPLAEEAWDITFPASNQGPASSRTPSARSRPAPGARSASNKGHGSGSRRACTPLPASPSNPVASSTSRTSLPSTSTLATASPSVAPSSARSPRRTSCSASPEPRPSPSKARSTASSSRPMPPSRSRPHHSAISAPSLPSRSSSTNSRTSSTSRSIGPTSAFQT